MSAQHIFIEASKRARLTSDVQLLRRQIFRGAFSYVFDVVAAVRQTVERHQPMYDDDVLVFGRATPEAGAILISSFSSPSF